MRVNDFDVIIAVAEVDRGLFVFLRDELVFFLFLDLCLRAECREASFSSLRTKLGGRL